MKRLLTSGLLLLIITAAHAQTADSTALATDALEDIRARGKYFGDSIVLRFVPLRPGVWLEGNKYGYQVERQEMDSTFARPFEKLNAAPLKPLPLEAWQSVVGDPAAPDTYAAVAAQSLYGKPSTLPSSLTERADLLLNNYSFALLAAEISPRVAAAEGLRLVDRQVQPNKLYRYRVFIMGQSPNEKLDTTYCTVSTYYRLPALQTALQPLTEGQNVLELRWLRPAHEAYFTAYHIERSDDGGKTFQRLTKVPYIQMDTKEHASKDYFYFRDSVATNYKPYHYRLVGLTTFGETSPPSPVVVGMGRDRTPPRQPRTVRATNEGGTRIRISWESDAEPDLKGFMIGRSTRTDVNYQPIATMLPPDARSFIDDSADVTQPNYYIVAAVDTANNGSVSLFAYGSIRDTIPPAVPTGLTGRIDTSGIVTVKWRLGPEKDIKGYKIAFSNSPNRPFVLADSRILRDTLWQDTIPLRTLTKKIYYKVMVVDMLDNYSAFSPALELTKPDKVPPVSAHFKEYKVDKEGIRLVWISSSSNDVQQHLLQRRASGASAWETLLNSNAKTELIEYVDKATRPNQRYDYQVLARDESGLYSPPSEILTLNAGDYRTVESVKNLVVKWDESTRTSRLNWQPTGVKGKITLYRATNGKSFYTLATLDSAASAYTDPRPAPASYEYAVKVAYEDGRVSDFSPIVKVTIPEN